jgi:hypothetical protein
MLLDGLVLRFLLHMRCGMEDKVRVFAREIWWHMKYEMENNIEYTINHNKSPTISGSCKSSFHELFQVWESNETITMLLTGNRRYLPWIHMARYNNGPYKVLWKTQPLTRSRWAMKLGLVSLVQTGDTNPHFTLVIFSIKPSILHHFTGWQFWPHKQLGMA